MELHRTVCNRIMPVTLPLEEFPGWSHMIHFIMAHDPGAQDGKTADNRQNDDDGENDFLDI